MRLSYIIRILQLNRVLRDAPVFRLIKVRGNSPFKVLVTSLLSTRTRDETTIKVVKKLFKVIKDANDLEKIPLNQLEKLLYPVGFYKTKAKHLKKLARIINKEYRGKVPNKYEELIKLPGVGDKVASIVLSEAYGIPSLVVDTNVHRIVNRLGILNTNNPDKTKKRLLLLLNLTEYRAFSLYLIALGQLICKPKRPLCEKCPLEKICLKKGVN